MAAYFLYVPHNPYFMISWFARLLCAPHHTKRANILSNPQNNMYPTTGLNDTDNSPIFNPKLACSKGGCIFFRPKKPKSPPRLADEQSDSVRASSSKVARNSSGELDSDKISINWRSSSVDSSLVAVILGSLHDDGRRESLCFFKICSTRTSLGAEALEEAKGAAVFAPVDEDL
eukprot:CAMPEP_0116834700 /NCGR_PEP_ID=MMETSP0418-20121206/7132_1 /TAXON_ID=1158023 /ORGANISM="Astrosyne radiata, Strain 13vi08-1A" /LENGTH=173 /DNA_ID=CAMNT_0004464279 /DNA_START=44 /DNA_END=566 /DNA_ORIENTATION=-